MATAVVTGVYWPSLHGGFFFDDIPNILLAEGLRLETLSLESIRQVFASGHSGPSGRPLAQLSFALNYYFNGFDPFAFKATNLAIHVANALLAFFLAFRLLASTKPQPQQRHALIAACLLASLWLLHPIQFLPVVHVVQRMTSLSAFFLLAAMLLHVLGRERGGRIGAGAMLLAWVVLWPLSFFSKETGALFPLFVLSWELILRRSTCGGLDGFARPLAAVTGIGMAVSLAYGLSPAGQWLWSGHDSRTFSVAERLLTEGRVLLFYLGLILFPRLEALGLYHDDITISTGLFTPWTTLPAWAVLAGLAYLAWRLRSSAPIIAFGIVWFLTGHVLESTVLPLEIAHEHRNYLPLFGILLAGTGLLMRSLESAGPSKTLGVALTAFALVYFSFITVLRANQFGNDVRRTQLEAQHHEDSARAQYEAGLILASLAEAASVDSPAYAFARAHYERAGGLAADFKLPWLGLIGLNCTAREPVPREWIEELGRRLRETPFAPGDRNVLYGLKETAIAGSLCLSRPDVDSLFAAALANPGVSTHVQEILHSWHTDYLWLHEHDLAAARVALTQSLALNPSNPSNRLKLAQLTLIAGEPELARKELLALRNAGFSGQERKLLNDLLSALDMMKNDAN